MHPTQLREPVRVISMMTGFVMLPTIPSGENIKVDSYRSRMKLQYSD
jgi:hypothetical protein